MDLRLFSRYFLMFLVCATSQLALAEEGYLSFEKRTVEIYKRTKDAVVFISTESYSRDALSYTTAAGNSHLDTGAGTGVIVDAKKRIILTSLHVISDADAIQILLSNGKTYRARLLGHDPQYDLAVLQLVSGPEDLTRIPFGDSRLLEVGQLVLAIGNPHGLSRTLTSGIVSSLHRTVQSPRQILLKDLIQTDAAINPGSSGGPLLNSRGELIGINTAILSQSGDSAGIGFAVPIHRILGVLPELIATGKVLRPRVGWVLVNTNQGPLVQRVFPNEPAAKGGVQPLERPVGEVFHGGVKRDFERADLIVRINGKAVHTVEDVEQLVLGAKRGEPITLTLRQGGRADRERELIIKPVLQ